VDALPPELTDAGVALRPECAEDRAFLIDLYAAERADELAFAPWSPLEKVRFIADQFRGQREHYRAAMPDGDFLIVERDRHVIGRLYLDRCGRTWRIAEIALIEAERGRGVGRALIRWVQAGVEAAGARGVDLHLTPDNLAARSLYERLGFREAASGSAARIAMRWTVS
jgi:RimJ/RimL family protein N-acetyltransferase